MVDIVVNENIINHTNEYDAILVPTNCYQVMSNGFQYEVSRSFPYVAKYNYQTKYGDNNKLGTILECRDKGKPLFVLAFVCFGYNFKGNDEEFLDYTALEKCLRFVNILYKEKHVATTMMGCTKFDGNGDRNKVLGIINSIMTDCDITIYDYKQETQNKIKQKEYIKNLKARYRKNKLKTRKTK